MDWIEYLLTFVVGIAAGCVLMATLGGCASTAAELDRTPNYRRAAAQFEIKNCGKGQPDLAKRRADCLAAKKQLEFWKSLYGGE